MENKKNRKGFTLAELLIVVAIIAVLVAIAIPVFTTQLEKSREATDIANLRSAYAGVVTEYLGGDTSASIDVPAKQTKFNEWTMGAENAVVGTDIGSGSGAYAKKIQVTAPKSASGWTVKMDNGEVKINAK